MTETIKLEEYQEKTLVEVMKVQFRKAIERDVLSEQIKSKLLVHGIP